MNKQVKFSALHSTAMHIAGGSAVIGILLTLTQLTVGDTKIIGLFHVVISALVHILLLIGICIDYIANPKSGDQVLMTIYTLLLNIPLFVLCREAY